MGKKKTSKKKRTPKTKADLLFQMRCNEVAAKNIEGFSPSLSFIEFFFVFSNLVKSFVKSSPIISNLVFIHIFIYFSFAHSIYNHLICLEHLT